MSEIQTRNGLYGFDFRAPDLRRNPEKKTYDIKSLWQRNHEIINLAARGYKHCDIADILGIHPQTVSNTLNSELGERKLSDIRLGRDEEAKKVSEKIRVITNKALDTYHEIFDDQDGQVSLKDKGEFAHRFLSDMSGLKAPTRIQSSSAHMVLTAEELEEFKRRGLEAARESGMIVDVEPVKEIEHDSVVQAGSDRGSSADSEEESG
jgi:predicted transcriptional regulator